MTQFDQLKILYSQLFNIADEIKPLVEKGEFNETISRLEYKDDLMRKFLTARKTMELAPEEQAEAEELEKKLIEKEQNNINFLKKIKDEAGSELKKTRKNLKLNAAYRVKQEKPGGILDFTE